MYAYLWIVTSWILVAVLCYLWLAVFGNNGVGGQCRAAADCKRTGEWFNEVIYWLWHSQKFSLAFCETFAKSLNDSFKRIAKTKNYSYEARFEFPSSVFTKDLCQSVRTRVKAAVVDESIDVPHLENVNASLDDTEHLVFNARLHIPKLTLKLFTMDTALEGKSSTHEIVFSDVHGEVEARIAQIADELFVMGCFSGRPQIRVTAKPIDIDASMAHSANDLEELARCCFASAVLNFSVGEIFYPDSTRDSMRLSTEIRNLSLLDDIYALESGDPTAQKTDTHLEQQKNLLSRKSPTRALIRILGARNIGHNRTPHSPFVTMEVDEPTQKFVTKSTHSAYNQSGEKCNPKWDETFEININSETKEFLFELYDSDERHVEARKFLGLAIIGLAEFAAESSSFSEAYVHQLALQARPYKTTDTVSSVVNNLAENVVSGTLLVQFQFIPDGETTHRVAHPAKFPIPINVELSRGTLKTFDQNYIHNADQQQLSSNDGINEGGNISIANSPLGDRWTGYNNRPELAFNQNTSETQTSTVVAPPVHTDVHASDHSSQFPPIQMSPSIQHDQQQCNVQPSPYDRFYNATTSIRKSPFVNLSSPSLEPPASSEFADNYEQFINNGAGPKRSPFRAASEKAIAGCETALSAKPKAALSPLQPDIFYFPLKYSENFAGSAKNINRTGKTSPQPPPVPPHHESRYDAELEKCVTDQARERESSSPLKTKDSKTRCERSFFDTLRERLTRGSTRTNKRGSTRARSLDTQTFDLEEAALSMPPSRDQSQGRAGISQYSEAITVSGGTHSPVRIPRLSRDGNIRSTLILEVVDNESGDKNARRYPSKCHKFEDSANENDARLFDTDDYDKNAKLKYYLIPHDVVRQPAAQSLLRAGKKLHIFNNHTFVAVKTRGRVSCSVCTKMIASNFIKQAYQCRDCRTVTHKSCHLRGTSPCLESTVGQLPIVDNVNWEEFFRQYQMQEFISVNGV